METLQTLPASILHTGVYLLYVYGRKAMKTRLMKWGNGSAVRIPAPVLRASRLHFDEAVDVREEAGRIVLEPLRKKRYDLEELVNGITPKNRHAAIDVSCAVGKEAW
jgi:antitoxin MazE